MLDVHTAAINPMVEIISRNRVFFFFLNIERQYCRLWPEHVFFCLFVYLFIYNNMNIEYLMPHSVRPNPKAK